MCALKRGTLGLRILPESMLTNILSSLYHVAYSVSSGVQLNVISKKCIETFYKESSFK